MEQGRVVFEGGIEDAINNYLTQSKNITLSLDERKDRYGYGKVKIKNLRILNEKVVETFEQLRILLVYESLVDDIRINEFGISIWDVSENRLISISSTFKNQLIDIEKTGEVICEIPKFPLVKGEYFVNAFVSSVYGLEDYVEKVISFNVEESDVFGTGKIVNPNWGKIVVNHNWKKYDSK